MLFRCGDFYETYSTDAIVAAEILGITLTKRANGKGKTIEMAGFPHRFKVNKGWSKALLLFLCP